MQPTRLIATLRIFQEHKVQFILVGGLAAVLNGAPIHTYDVDLVYSREPSNIDRLLGVLEKIDAIFRIQPQRRLRPTASHLAASGHLNLLTCYGPVDLLATIGRNLDYQYLLSHSDEMDIGEGIRICVLGLATIIAVKEQLGGEKDMATLPILRQTLKELNRKKGL
jgi:predicted nucleotidyltransferase